MSIRFVDLTEQQRRIRTDLDRRLEQVLAHGSYINGPELIELENKLAEFADCRHAVSVSSGTDALLTVLMARNIGPGDAVFLPSFTFAATAEVVLLCGATPVFVEVDASTFNLDPKHLHTEIIRIKKNGDLQPTAIITVDLFGQPADYQAINDLAMEYDLFVLADAAQSFGAKYHNRSVGSLAAATATSFYPAKPLGCYGDGGAIFTNDDELAATCVSLRAHGQGKSRYDIVRVGLNARLDTIQAAVLLSKLTIFEDEIRLRRLVAERYSQQLRDSVETPKQADGADTVWAQYTIKIANRDAVAEALGKQGIPTQIYYPLPMHLQPAYSKFGSGEGSLPVSERISQEVLALPMHPYLDLTATSKICDALQEALRRN